MQNHFVLDENRSLRTTGPEECNRTIPKGEMHLLETAITVENSHDQAVICQVQGKDRFGKVWQDIGVSVSVPAISGAVPGIQTFKVTDPWDVLKVVYTSLVAPSSGSLLCVATAHING